MDILKSLYMLVVYTKTVYQVVRRVKRGKEMLRKTAGEREKVIGTEYDCENLICQTHFRRETKFGLTQ